MGCLLRGKVQ
uniref:Uncharacterized protein n=1 Tax=Anguilla anguilla TaxID=7936 RepID=A0A0E9T7I6_ANGAN